MSNTFLPKFYFDASLDRALKIVMAHTELKTEKAAMELALVIWEKALLKIAQCGALLTPHGLE